MDLLHNFLNIVAPPICFITLLFFLPPFLFFKFILSIVSAIFSEDLAGKVVLITGASSGIGELAYQYARKGANLVLVARRENSLQEVAVRARDYGSPDVLVIRADVSKVDDCKRFVDEAVNHFGRLDHLVNNAGISAICNFEDTPDITKFAQLMDINYWGAVYPTYYAVPHLKESKGKIIVMASAGGWLTVPRMSFYNASKAAVINFFEALRVEFGPDIRITIATPGFIESEMIKGKFLSKEGTLELDQEMRDAQIGPMPVLPAEECAKGIVNSVRRGERYVTEPSWFKVTHMWKVFCPEVIEWGFKLFLITGPGTSQRETLAKKIMDVTGAKNFLYPTSIQSPNIKVD